MTFLIRARSAGPAVIAAVALLAAACGSGNDVTLGSGHGTASTSTGVTPGNPTPTGGSSAMTNVTMSETYSPPAETRNDDLRAAAKRAIDSVPRGTLYSLESEDDDTRWEVKIVDSAGAVMKIEVSRDGSEVLAEQQKDTTGSDGEKYLKRTRAAKIDYNGAIEVADRQVPGGRVDEVELDEADDGTLVWEMDVYDRAGTEHEIDVDAVTGELVSS